MPAHVLGLRSLRRVALRVLVAHAARDARQANRGPSGWRGSWRRRRGNGPCGRRGRRGRRGSGPCRRRRRGRRRGPWWRRGSGSGPWWRRGSGPCRRRGSGSGPSGHGFSDGCGRRGRGSWRRRVSLMRQGRRPRRSCRRRCRARGGRRGPRRGRGSLRRGSSCRRRGWRLRGPRRRFGARGSDPRSRHVGPYESHGTETLGRVNRIRPDYARGLDTEARLIARDHLGITAAARVVHGQCARRDLGFGRSRRDGQLGGRERRHHGRRRGHRCGHHGRGRRRRGHRCGCCWRGHGRGCAALSRPGGGRRRRGLGFHVRSRRGCVGCERRFGRGGRRRGSGLVVAETTPESVERDSPEKRSECHVPYPPQHPSAFAGFASAPLFIPRRADGSSNVPSPRRTTTW